jgi:NADP-dependent 3-hydroxy acid dehydrogenase YdfG
VSAPVSIITGAGGGVGRCIAVRLAAAGHRVALVGRTRATLEETAAACAGETLVVEADVAGEAEAIVARVAGEWGGVDALVNNAGVAPVVPIAETDAELMRHTFAVNTFGPARLIAACWPLFAARGAGCVVNVSSMATVDPFPGFLAYAASKAAVESFVRSIRNEGAEIGVRAFGVAPGAVETAMLRAIVDEDQLPSSCTLAPDDVAAVVVDCVLGRRDAEAGTTILLPSPAPA